MGIILIIWILCLIPIPDTPLNHVRLIDKWTHIAMYGGLCITIWAEYLHVNKTMEKGKLFIGGVLLPILMGGLIEIVQAYCTGGRRSGEWLDFAADSIGVIVGLIIGTLLVKILSKYRKDNATNENYENEHHP
ncbi:MAG: VanZ family protein [Prevotella sp.]|jgi:VanZ family protein|nr:VanZ family protein [Prevotella sp.]MCI1282232.1 VanZ family protein [Prevotella sp.]